MLIRLMDSSRHSRLKTSFHIWHIKWRIKARHSPYQILCGASTLKFKGSSMQRATTVKTMRTLKMKRKREKKHLSPSSRVLRSRLNSLECLTPTCCSFSSRGVQALPCSSTRMQICIWMSCLFSTTLLLKMGRLSEKLRAFFLATIGFIIERV